MAKKAGKGEKFNEWDLKPFCVDCYDNLSLDVRKRLAKYMDIEKKVNDHQKRAM